MSWLVPAGTPYLQSQQPRDGSPSDGAQEGAGGGEGENASCNFNLLRLCLSNSRSTVRRSDPWAWRESPWGLGPVGDPPAV